MCIRNVDWMIKKNKLSVRFNANKGLEPFFDVYLESVEKNDIMEKKFDCGGNL